MIKNKCDSCLLDTVQSLDKSNCISDCEIDEF
jgi:hypothetical protein